jgi:flagellar biosynthetic protein FliR
MTPVGLSALPDPGQLLIGALAFLRIGGIIFALPITGDPPTPVKARILLSLALTVGLYGMIPASYAPNMAVDPLMIASYVLRELLIGVVIGYIGRVAFTGLLMASSVVAYQMGFGTASLFLPDVGVQVDGFTAFHRMIVMLIFFTLGLHQIFLGAIVDSFRLIPGGGATLHGQLVQVLLTTTAGIFTTSLQLAAPVLVALLFTMAALGLLARTVPQMNIFSMSFPFSFFIGLVVYIATFPFFPEWIRGHFLASQEGLTAAMRSMMP